MTKISQQKKNYCR